MYKWDPEDHHRHSLAQECIAEDVISGLKVEGNEFIYDIDSGDGKVTSKLASLVPQGRVLGIDGSKEIILPGKAGFEGFIRITWLPITERVTVGLRSQLIRKISERHIGNHPLREGFAIVNMSVQLVEARRPHCSKIASESIVSESDILQLIF